MKRLITLQSFIILPPIKSFAQSVGIVDHEFTPHVSAAPEIISAHKSLLLFSITE